ncbi:hypothetical protein [Deinococcus peraridilitoris]|uniref:Uncharacterized protein n=1 Tax=Deinococcus peraridilitoris (strain DSM 19664 / LMG 22246 / CIP 109416 / KR-200) TaxID=937777 RepID=L0A6B9_DEIPD|nr:hypothetical protein [Deinococcus peraridilitoris]AFZ68994.1 hypothetical protein Deipe_3564 [Deinococcus peraridilitoris DSM 19664]
MPDLPSPLLQPGDHEPILTDPETRAAYAMAARAVLAGKYPRAPLRVVTARLRPTPEVRLAEAVHSQALRTNRAFLEEVVMVELAPLGAEQIKFGAEGTADSLERARQLLLSAAQHDDEALSVDSYLTVLLARTRGSLRHCWPEVEVVALALIERGVLDEVEIAHRVRCVQGIRSVTLN